MKKILVIGSANVDMIVKVQALPMTGETVLGKDFYKLPGGKGANQAVAAQRSGGAVTFLACVGEDAFGAEAIAGYEHDGIQTAAIQKIPNVSTGVALITVDECGNNTIAVASGANLHLDEALIRNNDALIASHDIILLQLETPLPAVTAAIELAHQAKRFIVLNPAPAQALPAALLAKVDILTPNEVEAERLTGVAVYDVASAEKASSALLEMGVSKVIITLGDNGVFYNDGTTATHYPCYAVNAVDTTAAGDTFNGALVSALSQGKEIEAAIAFAQTASALSVTKIGAQSAIPNQADIAAFSAAL